MKFFYTHVVSNIGLYVLLVFFSWLFFFKLDYSTLSAWDEAWYGAIARDMLARGDFLRMHFNTLPFFDHPPAGFWLMALSYKLLGISEFSTRLPSALCGIGAILLTYLTGAKLFGKKSVGFVAALILGTCVWYVLRVRSGNLDAPFVFFYLLTVYTSLRSRENIKWFIPTMISFALLFLTKTLVGASAIILVLLLNSNHLIGLIKQRKRKQMKYILGGFVICVLIIAPWYIIHLLTYHNFYQHHFIDIGTRNKTFDSYFKLSLDQPLFYLHMGIRKWYYLWIAGLGIIFAKHDFHKKNVLFVLFWNALVLYPFLTTNQTQIWHLIPVYLPLSLITAYAWCELFTSINRKMLPLFILMFVVIGMWQVKSFYAEVIPTSKYTPDDVSISKSSHSLKERVFLDDDFLPMAVFYADRVVYPIRELPFYGFAGDKSTLVKFFQSDEKQFAVIARKWATGNLDGAKIPYKIIAENDSFVIVTR